MGRGHHKDNVRPQGATAPALGQQQCLDPNQLSQLGPKCLGLNQMSFPVLHPENRGFVRGGAAVIKLTTEQLKCRKNNSIFSNYMILIENPGLQQSVQTPENGTGITQLRDVVLGLIS